MTANPPDDGKALIVAERLTRGFAGITAVADVAFSIQAGEVVGLLGVNGAGKSTLLRILAGFIPPTQGRARIAGWDIVEQSLAARRGIGYLPEQVALYGDMQVYEHLKYRARLKGLHGSDCRRRVTEILSVCDLENVAGHCIASLSRGYRQRVGLADALVHDPPVLLLDEPGLGLDPNQMEHLRRLLTQSRDGRRAVLFSSHGLSDIERTCGRVMVMHKGKIVAEDTPQRLIERWRGHAQFVMEARGNVGALLQACRSLEKVVSALVEPGDDGWSRLRIEAAKGADLGAELFDLAIRSNCVLREFRRERDRLDDVFAAITRPTEERVA